MERLTKRNEADSAYYYPKCFEKCDGIGSSSKCENCELSYNVCKKLGNYEDLEEQGRLIKLPCKVGDTVYHVIQGRIVEVSNIDLFFLLLSVAENRFNNSVFLTKSEAEAKLSEMKKNESEE